MRIDNTYDLGDIVYLRARSESLRGMVVGIMVRQGGIMYLVTWGNGTTDHHYDIELSTTFIPDFSTSE